MVSRRRLFAGLLPLSVGAAPIPQDNHAIYIRPYTAWECCACGMCMLGLSSTGQTEKQIKCVNRECRNFEKVVGIPTFKTHEPNI